jgi:hypothetical protein
MLQFKMFFKIIAIAVLVNFFGWNTLNMLQMGYDHCCN